MFDTLIMPFLMALRYLLLIYAITTLLTEFKIKKGLKVEVVKNKDSVDEQRVDISKHNIFENILVRIIFSLSFCIFIYFDLMGFGQGAFLNIMRVTTVALIGFDVVVQFRYKSVDSGKKLIKIKKYLSEDLTQILTKIFLIAIAWFLPIIIKHVIAYPESYAMPQWLKIF